MDSKLQKIQTRIRFLKGSKGQVVFSPTDNYDFMLEIADNIRLFVLGKQKTIKCTIYSDDETAPIDMTTFFNELLIRINEQVSNSMNTIEKEVSLDIGQLKEIIDPGKVENDSFRVIKMHLIIQWLLWRYVEIKLNRLPRQYSNWNFLQLIDLVEALKEIPHRAIKYFYSLNELRNKIAHHPRYLTFSNIKSKHKLLLYKEGAALHGLKNEPQSDKEILTDWINLFLVSIIEISDLLENSYVKYPI